MASVNPRQNPRWLKIRDFQPAWSINHHVLWVLYDTCWSMRVETISGGIKTELSPFNGWHGVCPRLRNIGWDFAEPVLTVSLELFGIVTQEALNPAAPDVALAVEFEHPCLIWQEWVVGNNESNAIATNDATVMMRFWTTRPIGYESPNRLVNVVYATSRGEVESEHKPTSETHAQKERHQDQNPGHWCETEQQHV
jgi:hypothetical protein